MARSRIEFRNELQHVMGANKLYFQPPDGTKITYPCCIYKLQNIETNYADDSIYRRFKCYSVTIIDSNPDSIYPDKILDSFDYARFDRFFTSENLNHYVFTIYY